MARFCFFSAPKSTSVRTRLVSWNRCRLLWALQAIGDRAQDPQTDALGFRIADEIERLVDEFEIETWICRHLSQMPPPYAYGASHGVSVQ